MKKMILFIAAGLMMMTTAQANENLVNKDNLKGELTRYRNAQPVLFALNGIDYAVYPSGRIEFELPRTSRVNNNRNYRSTNRRYDLSNRSSNRNNNLVSYNRKGQVVKIGTTRISYLSNGKVARIGYINVDYTKRGGILNEVGQLKVRYNQYGKIIDRRGQVIRKR